jgi:hypothetical protein
VKCPHCGSPAVCAACGSFVEPLPPDIQRELEDLVQERAAAAPSSPPPDHTFLIVARGHEELLDQLKEVVGELGWVRLVEDRRQDETLLPREGREGTRHVDREEP